ncbi:hypothetical protein HS99_0009715 [Kitasatospora aureofaciens]|uniref:Uncharacterized protein n=1 Tax=Kitasatospora aureofaciens TaxID=1894 RepID=A0A1E7N219_KITAU|nr:hypothetical protein HS99_0009715 [Kitasatospora aureofaciens]
MLDPVELGVVLGVGGLLPGRGALEDDAAWGPTDKRTELPSGAELSSFADGPFDVRAVAAVVRTEAKNRFLLDEVPWANFPQGDHVREAICLFRADGPPVAAGVGVVSGMCANGMRAAAALAVA